MAWHSFYPRPLPDGLEGLTELALDLRWSSVPPADRLWARLDPDLWDRTHNPYVILQEVSEERLQGAARDQTFRRGMADALDARRRTLEGPGWFEGRHGDSALGTVAYFSMEYGLGENLPLYAGGLGILAGDHLKTASDLGVPITGVGLLYEQGYFQQQLTADGWQVEAYPYNDPTGLPVTPVQSPRGGWLRVTLPLPGRALRLRVWQAQAGRVRLYLLDSNDPLNSPGDRAITASLYQGEPGRRLLQELALGVGGWRALEALGVAPDVCHLNEGHAAFVTLARARRFMADHGGAFDQSLWATRPGNVFTTHTPVPAGFDRFDVDLVRRHLQPFADEAGLDVEALLALGREPDGGAFNMAWLATRASGRVNAVSALHGRVSRALFAPLYPRWPLAEVPVGHVTNGVHMPSWTSGAAQALWTRVRGDSDVPDSVETVSLAPQVASPALSPEDVGDRELFEFRAAARRELVAYVRRRLGRQLQAQGADAAQVARAGEALDPGALTVGFARRFATYKRPTLLLHDLERLARLLTDAARPVQLIVAGKAHPSDDGGKRLIQQVVRASLRPDLFGRLVFLADYDIALARRLAAGVDLWVNTPRRPMEACGTSGMKVLVNGGLNLSELDGWWAEAYSPEVGWALGDGQEHDDAAWDAVEAERLYALLEQEIVPAFYGRDAAGLPAEWLRRVRESMRSLTPRFNSQRMVREYAEKYYLPGAAEYRQRVADGGAAAGALADWARRLAAAWPEVTVGGLEAARENGRWAIAVRVGLGGLAPDDVRLELYADGKDGGPAARVAMTGDASPSPDGARVYRARVPADRPAEDYTPRIVPAHPDALVPQECALIRWPR